MVAIMKKLLLLIILCGFTAAAVEIENEALIKEAIGIIGEYKPAKAGERVELYLSDYDDEDKITGTLRKLDSSHIYLDLEDGTTAGYRQDDISLKSRWIFFKEAYYKRLADTIYKLAEDKRRLEEAKLQNSNGQSRPANGRNIPSWRQVNYKYDAIAPYFEVVDFADRRPAAAQIEAGGGITNIEAAVTRESGVFRVKARGQGGNIDDALKQAFKDAIRKVVGVYVDSLEIVKNEEVIEDRIITHSNAFIKDYLKTTPFNSGIIEIEAVVVIDDFESALKNNQITFKANVSGYALVAETSTKLDGLKDAISVFQNIFQNFPRKITRISASEVKLYNEEKGLYVTNIKIETDPLKYQAFVKETEKALDSICKGKCIFKVYFKEAVYADEKDKMKQRELQKLGFSPRYSAFSGTRYRSELNSLPELKAAARRDPAAAARLEECKKSLRAFWPYYCNALIFQKIQEFWKIYDFDCSPFRIVRDIDYDKGIMTVVLYAVPGTICKSVDTINKQELAAADKQKADADLFNPAAPCCWNDSVLMVELKNGIDAVWSRRLLIKRDYFDESFDYTKFPSLFSQKNKLSYNSPFPPDFSYGFLKNCSFEGTNLYSSPSPAYEISPYFCGSSFLAAGNENVFAEICDFMPFLYFPFYMKIPLDKLKDANRIECDLVNMREYLDKLQNNKI